MTMLKTWLNLIPELSLVHYIEEGGQGGGGSDAGTGANPKPGGAGEGTGEKSGIIDSSKFRVPDGTKVETPRNPDATQEPESPSVKPEDVEAAAREKGEGSGKGEGEGDKPTEVPLKGAFDWLTNKGVQMPKDVNLENMKPEEVYQLFADTVIRNTDFSQAISPEALALDQAIREGKAEDFYKERATESNMLSLSPREFLKQVYMKDNGKSEQNPHGYTPEEMETFLDTMERDGRLKMEYKREREAWEKEYKSTQPKQPKELTPEEKKQAIEKARGNVRKEVDGLFNKLGDTEEVYGVPVSKAEMEKFRPIFEELVTPTEAGEAPIYQMLRDDKALFKMIYAATQGGNQVKSFITNLKEDTKKALFDRLGLTARQIEKEEPRNPGDVDITKFRAPERNT